jgi:2'-5' RNA ligase
MRTFVAIPIPPNGPARRFLAVCQDRLTQAGGDVRWTRPDQWHITLRFLGETTEQQLPALREAVEKAAREVEPFDVRLHGWGVFPERGQPRVVWAGGAGEARSLYEVVSRTLANIGFAPEPGSFRPHVTLARIKPGRDVGSILRMLRDEPPPPRGAFAATHVTLFQSVLSPEGSTYIPLLKATLGE